MSLRGKGSTLGTKLLGSKLVFLMLQPRAYTLEDYQCSSWSCAVRQAHLATGSIGFLCSTNGVGVEHHTPNCFRTLNQKKKPMEVGRCACITAQLQLRDGIPQWCQILAAAQEKLDPSNLQVSSGELSQSPFLNNDLTNYYEHCSPFFRLKVYQMGLLHQRI